MHDGMIDPEEAPPDMSHGPAICGVCDGPLPTTRYVHVETRSVVVLCSVPCFRAIVRARWRVRWAARRREAVRTAVTLILASILVTPHAGPAGHRRIARAAPAPAPHSALASPPALP